jgi:hypothetical protein
MERFDWWLFRVAFPGAIGIAIGMLFYELVSHP